MCELTYSNLHDPYLNSLATYLLSTIGSNKHDDGCGMICSNNSIWKTNLAANKITNLGNIIFKFVNDDKPLPFHIRRATFGIEVTKENAHPFDGKHYILMHNGTLIPKIDDSNYKDTKHDSDSLRFLLTLDKVKEKSPKKAHFDTIFNDAMKDFSGKFAFIIRDKDTNQDYIVRGRTAELWISRLKVNNVDVGYLINTSKETIKDATLQFINIATFTLGNTYEFSDPTLLEPESIFKAEDKVIKRIGDAKESYPVKVAKSSKEHTTYIADTTTSANGIIPYTKKSGITHSGSESTDVVDILKYSERIYNFLHKNSLGILDLQILLYTMGGISILELNKEDLQMFCNHVIDKLSATKTMKIQVQTILSGMTFPLYLYDKYDLEYPWTVNTGDKVLKALKELKG